MNKSFLQLALLLFSLTLKAQVIFKNTGWTKVYVAICYFDKANGWTSKGWFNIEPNEEVEAYKFNQFNNPNFYYCAKIDNCDKGYFGDLSIYVNTKNAFTIPNADKEANYTNDLIKRYKFKQVSLKGKERFTIELQPINLICNENPQGKWRLLLDRDGNYAEKKEDAKYYREITFDNGRPLGWCKDFYEDGKTKAEFKLLSYKPTIYDGKCTWYKNDGTIEKETTYINGSPINSTNYSSSGETITKTAKYETVTMPIQNFYINSISNEDFKGGNSKVVYPVNLPENTIEWYYEFTASRDKAEVEANTNMFSVASQLTKLADKTGILSTTINMITAPPGGNVCNVYLLDYKYYNQFLADKDWRHYPTGSRLNYKSGVVQIRGINIDKPLIGIKNPDMYNGIHVSLQVVAVVSKID